MILKLQRSGLIEHYCICNTVLLFFCRTCIWDFLEKPWTSAGAQLYAVASLGVILFSTITFIVSTFDELQADEEGNQAYPEIIFAFEVVDFLTVFIFTIEYFARLLCSPVKWKFFFKPLWVRCAPNRFSVPKLILFCDLKPSTEFHNLIITLILRKWMFGP